MSSFLLRTVVNGLALWLAAVIVPGIQIGKAGGSTTDTVITVLLVAVVFGVINAIVKPVLTILSIPFIVLTLGLFLLVLNALLLELTSWLSDTIGLSFHIDHFWWDAIWGALIITIVSMILNAFVPDRQRVR